ncbi:MAG: efflux RND transporter periplasmic adaptor subunit, partial [Candidatus Moranbacteria bacterium]|nr:efflux RND transporter periplasmic adaptor subunit [Candidatus Moranbacteria bacterium]
VVRKSVSETATLISEIPVNLNFEIQGRIKEIRAVEGQTVSEGEILALLDQDQLNIELEKAKIALEEAKARAGANNDAIREAEVAVENAEDILDDTEELEDQKVEAAKDSHEKALEYYAAMEDYYNSFSDKNSKEAKFAYTQLVQASNSVNSAKEAKQTAEESKDLNLQTAKNNLESAKAALKTLESAYTQKANNSLVDNARSNYNLALSKLEKATLTAPVNGRITKINYQKGEIISAASTKAFGEIITSDLILEADIPETDIVFVKTGQSGLVSFDSLEGGETLQAKVIEIAPSSTIIQEVVYYKVKLKLDSMDSRLKVGMSADVDINIEEKRDVIKISERAVRKNDNGTETVLILNEKGEVQEVAVETGLSGDEGIVEIESGLNEGDKIILQEKESVLEL